MLLPKKITVRRRLIYYSAVASCILFSAAALAVDAPYSDNFDSYPSGAAPNNFVTQTSGTNVFGSTWNVQNSNGTSGAYRNNAGGDFVRTSAAVSVTNLAQSDFVLSTTFVINSYGIIFSPSSPNIHIGLGALASNVDFSTSGYELQYQLEDNAPFAFNAGTLAFYKDGAGYFPNVSLPVVIGATYTMTLTGAYSVNGLQLKGTLSNGTSSVSTTIVDSSPEQGTYFGYGDYASGQINGGVGVDVSYDNFTIAAVPEAQSVSLLIIGGAMLLTLAKKCYEQV